jgi:hypothetical protein
LTTSSHSHTQPDDSVHCAKIAYLNTYGTESLCINAPPKSQLKKFWAGAVEKVVASTCTRIEGCFWYIACCALPRENLSPFCNTPTSSSRHSAGMGRMESITGYCIPLLFHSSLRFTSVGCRLTRCNLCFNTSSTSQLDSYEGCRWLMLHTGIAKVHRMPFLDIPVTLYLEVRATIRKVSSSDQRTFNYSIVQKICAIAQRKRAFSCPDVKYGTWQATQR